ncbi:MAG: small multi-drug export protein [Proteobacteria bacterium]|nr:small multi-drug export protein [Pseudomonadota bacterium]
MDINYLWVFLMAAAPIWELRGAIPAGMFALHLPWPWVFLAALIGNILPVPLIMLFLDPVTRLLSRIALMEKFFNWIFARTRRRTAIVEKYERIGLMLFVAVPLPGTGAWTGSLIAFLLGMSLKSAFLPIAVGVFIAGVIVTALCLLGWIGALIAGIGLGVLAVLGLWKI